MVTGQSEEEGAGTASPFRGLDRPIVALVADPGVALADLDKLEDVVFKAEKVGLAMKAFRAVRISPENAEKDPVLSGHGKDVPRLLVIDPVKEKVKVLAGSKISASALFAEMKKVADGFYEEKLEKLVKDHLKLLTERDQVANEEKTLKDKEGRLTEEGAKAEKDLAGLREELARVQKDLEDLAAKERDLWKLTPKAA